MRVAIFSDVHGNLTALEAVLDHIDKQAPDLTIFAGDLCAFGARPSACLNLVRTQEIICVYGNTDEWIDGPPLLSDDVEEEERQRRQNIHDGLSWTAAQLGEMDRAWLRALPFHRRISPTINPRDDLLVVHANPLDVDRVIFPTAAAQQEKLGEVQKDQADTDLRPLLKDLVTDVLAFGHFHFPNIRHWQNVTLANISSVSLPMDGDPRAKYGLLTWEQDSGWTIEHQYVEYDIEKEIKTLSTIKPPDWESLGRRLQPQA